MTYVHGLSTFDKKKQSRQACTNEFPKDNVDVINGQQVVPELLLFLLSFVKRTKKAT